MSDGEVGRFGGVFYGDEGVRMDIKRLQNLDSRPETLERRRYFSRAIPKIGNVSLNYLTLNNLSDSLAEHSVDLESDRPSTLLLLIFLTANRVH